jgi:hypothetical protein
VQELSEQKKKAKASFLSINALKGTIKHHLFSTALLLFQPVSSPLTISRLKVS